MLCVNGIVSKTGLRKLLPTASEDLITLLEGLLEYDPDARFDFYFDSVVCVSLCVFFFMKSQPSNLYLIFIDIMLLVLLSSFFFYPFRFF